MSESNTSFAVNLWYGLSSLLVSLFNIPGKWVIYSRVNNMFYFTFSTQHKSGKNYLELMSLFLYLFNLLYFFVLFFSLTCLILLFKPFQTQSRLIPNLNDLFILTSMSQRLLSRLKGLVFDFKFLWGQHRRTQNYI